MWDGQLYSASGQRFIARGINLRMATTSGRPRGHQRRSPITGANIVRLQLRKHNHGLQELRGVPDAIVARKHGRHAHVLGRAT